MCVEEHVDAFVGPQRARVEQIVASGGHEIGARGGPIVAGKSEEIIVDERRDHLHWTAVGRAGRRPSGGERRRDRYPLGDVAMPSRSELVQSGGQRNPLQTVLGVSAANALAQSGS